MSARRLLMWRHGRTTWNAEKRYQGQADAPLDELGREQALASAPLLAAEKPQLVLCSDLGRTTATAQVLIDLLDGVELRFDKRLRESDMGRWQGLTRPEVEETFPEEFKAWQNGEVLRRGGGELAGEVADRAVACLSEVDVETLVVVSHGGTIKAITGRLLELEEPMWRIISPLANCHWTELRLEHAGWRLQKHNVGARGIPLSPALSRVDSEPAVDADETAGDSPRFAAESAADGVEVVDGEMVDGEVVEGEVVEGEPVPAGSASDSASGSGSDATDGSAANTPRVVVDTDAEREQRAAAAGRDVAGTYRLAQLRGELPEQRP